MDASTIKFTYQVTYPPRVYILIYFYENNELGKIVPAFRREYLMEMADFIKHLKELSETNDTEPRITHILDTLEGITTLNDYLLALWKIEPNTKIKTMLNKTEDLTMA